MLKIFNTITKKKEIFNSILDNKVNIYVCGVTISDYCHIGHSRTFYFFDILVRYLKYLGYSCTYIRNITDIDNKLINKSLKKNISLKNLSSKMINLMYNDFSKLGLLNPNLEPKITDNIKYIILSIIKLIKYNYAYISNNGDVLFSYENFYKIFKSFFFKKRLLKIKENDFVLWKVNKKYDYYGWNSPWGLGRPGWHIECSVISNKYLCNTIDIHGGGSDLIFPHHENELIQSKCLFGFNYFIKYWIHTGLVISNNKKLSKTDNNVFLLNKMLIKYFPDVIKYYLMSVHYRRNLYFDIEKLNLSKIAIKKLYLGLYGLNLNLNFNKNDLILFKEFDNIFLCYMNDDLNILGIQKLLFLMLFEINKFKEKNFILASKFGIKMKFFASFLGLLQYNVKYFLSGKYFYNKKNYFNLLKKINYFIYYRNIARKNNNWIKADYYRNKLYKLNIYLKDKKNFITEWFFMN